MAARALLALLALLALAPVAAGVMLSFASYYGDHMVLQREPAGAVVWGYGEPGATVTVTLSRDGGIAMKKTALVRGPSGTWTTVLDPMAPGGPYVLAAGQGSANVTLRDIYFGDVWLCSGQSNMAMTVLQVANASQELAAAARYPHVRLFAAARSLSHQELEDLEGIDLPWSIPTAENLGHGNFTFFSAVCWLLGRHLHEALGYPMGLVEAAWGGTPIEAWSSRRALRACGLLAPTGSPSPHPSGPQTSSVLWNAMIHPLLNMTLRGVAWYQGEGNALLHTELYSCTFPALVADWRRAFHAGSAGQTEPLLPFGFVQLSGYRGQSPDDAFARLRWHQTADAGVVPNARLPRTFMAVAMDLGDERSPYGSIHPRDKQSVAHRLLLGALAVAYGQQDVVFQGPFPTGAVLGASGAVLNLTYSQELRWHRGAAPAFQVCCSSPCRWLPAPVVAVVARRVTLALPGCGTMVLGLRYAWAQWPCDYQACALYNAQGLPAPPCLLQTLPARGTPGGTELLLLPSAGA